MRTTLNLPDALVSEAMKVSDKRTRTETIVEALREYVRARRVKHLISIRGKLQFTNDWERARHSR